MLKLTAPQKTAAELIALGASGARRIAPAARAELQSRLHQALAQELALRRAQQSATAESSDR